MKAAALLLACLALAALASRSAEAAPAASAPARPNIVFIYVDDMRWDALGVVQREQGDKARFPWIRTPQLDRLASEGVRFRESFVVNSLCSPGRACVLTGRYNHHNGIIGNTQPFPVDAATLATQLRKAGYTTGYFGKFHMGQQTERPGFDKVASFIGQGRYNDCPINLDGNTTPTKGWIDDVTTGYATGWIREQKSDRPFLAFIGFKSPHGPRGGENLPERARNLYADAATRPVPNLSARPPFKPGEAARAKAAAGPAVNPAIIDYMRHIAAIDSCVGTILGALEQSGALDNTIVAFASDNGYYLGEHTLGDKRSAYDESLRVPLLVRLPGRGAPRGITSDAMVLNIDYAPTFLDYAGAPAIPQVQGRSLRPVLDAAGRVPAAWREAFFYEYFKEAAYESPTVLAVRTATHKLITYPNHEDWTELYDLAADPFELRNLAADSALRARLVAVYEREAAAVGFRWPAGFNPETAEKAVPQKKAGKKGGKKKGVD